MPITGDEGGSEQSRKMLRVIPECSMVRKIARELHTKPSAKNISESRLYRGVRFRSCGTMGYGPTLCVQSRKSGDTLHGYDSKACHRIACQLCWHHRWYQGRGTKRTIFLLVGTRQTIRQSSRPSVVIKRSSTIVTES